MTPNLRKKARETKIEGIIEKTTEAVRVTILMTKIATVMKIMEERLQETKESLLLEKEGPTLILKTLSTTTSQRRNSR